MPIRINSSSSAVMSIVPPLAVAITHIDDSIKIGDGTTLVDVTGSNELQTRDDDANTTLTSIETDTSALAGTVAGSEQQVDIVTSALPSGAATQATLATIDADTSVLAGTVSGSEQQVDVVTSALPTGAAAEATLTTIDTDTSALAGTVAGSELQVDIVTSALPVGAATESTLSTFNAKFVSGTDIGDTTNNNAGGASAVNVQDGGNSLTVDAVDLDIRDLDHAIDDIRLGDGTNLTEVSVNGDLQTADTSNTSFVTGTVAITTSEAEAKVGASPLADRKMLYIENQGNATVFYGPTGVLATNGGRLTKNQSVFLSVGPDISIFVLTSASTATLTVQEFS